MMNVKDFFESFSDEYTEAIHRCNPCYDEMIGSLLTYFPPTIPQNILEIGCGTGNLTCLIRNRYPDSVLVAVDISQESLDICEERLRDPTVVLKQLDIREVQFEPESCDLILSSLALHHLEDEERSSLYASVFQWLNLRGRFLFCDRYKDESTPISLVNRHIWKESAFKLGTTEDEWAKWMQHENDHDHPGLLLQQLINLQKAGFAAAEVLWRKYLWATIFAHKV